MTDASPEDLISSLSVVISAARQADPECRKVVFAVERDGPEQARSRAIRTIAAAEAAGLRYVVDVDVPGHELSLLVSEPDWVTEVDMDLDHVPGT
ncbi:hypothetical protein [Gordonia sp. C13]|uniref:hypothetical protein n=1 Tax=Gordonia sp. C13 TaxID=2935078 RepID=UPI00200AFC42|nr:hypothetical protein [Gordonia sp. C13]MCK8616298.1 hypothetical protein [Gordonia sp. C13]